MDLPTYTNIWRIEKRLYKLYDFRLPMPLPVGQIAVFTAIAVPYVVILKVAGLPFSHTLLWLYILPPGALAWVITRPVLESKRLPELVVSQLRYLSEPRTWCRMAPLAEKDEIVITARVWRRAGSQKETAGQPQPVVLAAAAAGAVPTAPARPAPPAAVPAPARQQSPMPSAGKARSSEPEGRRALQRRVGDTAAPAWPDQPARGVRAPMARDVPDRDEEVRPRAVREAPNPGKAARGVRAPATSDVPAQGRADPAAAARPVPEVPAPVRAAAASGLPDAPAAEQQSRGVPPGRVGRGIWVPGNQAARPVPAPDRPAGSGSASGQAAAAVRAPDPAAVAVAGEAAAAVQAPGQAAEVVRAPGQAGAAAQASDQPAAVVQARDPAAAAVPAPGEAAEVVPAPGQVGAVVQARDQSAAAIAAPGQAAAVVRATGEAGAAAQAPGEAAAAVPGPGRAVSAAVAPPAASAPPASAPPAPPAASAPPAPSAPPRPVVTVTGDQDAERPLRVVERALGNPSGRRGSGWHDHVVVVPGGHRPGRPDQMQRDRARARLPVRGGHRVVVLGCTVGAGQTVTTLLLGELLASLRGEEIAVLDLNPGAGSLAERARAVPALTGSRPPAPSLAEVITREAAGSGADPPDREDVTKVFELLSARYPLTLADPGAAAVPRVLAAADQLVLVAPASRDAASALATTREWLEAHGHAELADQAIVVLNGVSRHTVPHVEQAEALARGRCRAIVRVPWDDRLKNQGPERLPRPAAGPLTPAALHAYTALAGVLIAALAAAPERLRVRP